MRPSSKDETHRLRRDTVRDVRARAWAFIFKCHQKKKAAERPVHPGPGTDES